MVHGGMTLVKYLLFLFNFIFWLSGIAVIVAGAVIQIKYSTYINFLGNSFLSAPILLIVVGCVVAVLGFFGCCGAIRENYCMTMTFAVLLGVIFILELATGIASYILRQDVEDVVEGHTKTGMLNFNKTEAEGVTLAWNNMQQEFKCCGTEGYTDWLNVTMFKASKDVPQSCCRNPTPSCGKGKAGEDIEKANQTIYVKGCKDGFKNWVKGNVAMVGGIGVGVAFIQVIGIIFSCCYGQGLRKGYEAV